MMKRIDVRKLFNDSITFIVSRRRQLIIITVIHIFVAIIISLLVPHFVLPAMVRKMNASSRFTISYARSEMRGVAGIALDSLVVADTAGKPVVSVGSMFVRVKIFPLLFGHVRPKRIEMSDTYIIWNSVIPVEAKDKKKHKKEKEIEDTAVVVRIDYVQKLSRMSSAVFGRIPKRVVLKNFNVLYVRGSDSVSVSIPDFLMRKGKFNAQVMVGEARHTDTLCVKGVIDGKNKKIDAGIYTGNEKQIALPAIQTRFGVQTAFDSLHFAMQCKKVNSKTMSLQGSFQTYNAQFHHWRIAEKDVKIGDVDIAYKLNIGENYAELDSATNIVYHKIALNPYVKVTISPSKQLIMKLDKKDIPANDFFAYFPEGLMQKIKGVEAEGTLDYHLYCNINLAHPDSLVFEMSLKPEKFRLRHIQSPNIGKLRDSCIITIYDYPLVRTVSLGNGNSYYTPIERIPDYLKKAVVTAEDPEFYYHRGFSESGFREALIKNIREKRFAQGGSTISMQLVKNVFLDRDKNIARKFEEALIVWLIEQNHLVSKERLLEVYLNIIEWGPNVYGVGEASHFYFGKAPENLTLSESVFLASMIPWPKRMPYMFDNNKQLKSYMARYFGIISQRMVIRNLVAPADTQNAGQLPQFAPNVWKYVKIDSTFIDTSAEVLDTLWYVQ